MAIQNIDWAWGENTHVKFDPATDVLDFGWIQGGQFSLSEVNGSVVISIPSNEQTYTLDGVTLSELNMSNISAKDVSATATWNNVIGTGTTVPVTVPVITPVADPATDTLITTPVVVPVPPSGLTPHVQKIDWEWGVTTHVNFNPSTDELDFGWMQADQFSISEKNGSVVISIPSNNQSYVLDGISLTEMNMSDITALDSSTTAAWATAIKNAGGETNTSADDNQQIAPAGNTPYEYAPYIDMSLYQQDDLTTISQKSGIHDFTLAFMVSDGQHGLSWGGVTPISSDTEYASEISSFEKVGGKITLSFGGSNGTEAALDATNASDLAALYQSAIDKYHTNSIDFDIEGAAINNKSSVDLRNQAIAILEKNNPLLEVSYTLPALPDGLTLDGTNLLDSAAANNARVDIVNIMAMDYGGDYDSKYDNQPDMGDAAISAANSTLEQLKSAGLVNTKVGITPMIGLNDDNNEVFTLQDATKLANYAASNSDVGRLSNWSVARDNGSGAGQHWASPTSSSLQQNDYDFAKAFMAGTATGQLVTAMASITPPSSAALVTNALPVADSGPVVLTTSRVA